ncbi:MAG: hypothetical protein U0Z44_04780 [Kouleothrix sp.]
MQLAHEQRVDLVAGRGPEYSLAAGLADRFTAAGIAVFGLWRRSRADRGQ